MSNPRRDPLLQITTPFRVMALVSLTALATFSAAVSAQVTLHGASQFNADHAFNQTLRKFEGLVAEYYGKPVKFVLHENSELGVEKDYVSFMNQGMFVDYAVVAPGNLANFAPAAPLMDMPFLFRDLEHWNAVLSSDTFEPIAKQVAERADVVVLGYAGGGVRNLVSTKKIRNLAELKGFKIRVQGAPIHTRIFEAVGASPSVISYSMTYYAIQKGVVQGLENEAAGIEQFKFYEVAPFVDLTQHSITVRPILFSGKTFRRLPEDLQSAILKAGKEAGEFGRTLEASEDQKKLDTMANAKLLEVVPFENRDKLFELAAPVQDEYAKELQAEDILTEIRNR